MVPIFWATLYSDSVTVSTDIVNIRQWIVNLKSGFFIFLYKKQ